MIKNFLNPEGHQNPIIGSKVTAILLKGCILPIGGVASGRVCAWSLRSRLIYASNELLLLDMQCLRRFYITPQNIAYNFKLINNFNMFTSLKTELRKKVTFPPWVTKHGLRLLSITSHYMAICMATELRQQKVLPRE